MEGEMSTAITQYEGQDFGLTQWRPPEQVLGEAKQAADALTRVISLKKNPVKFNNEIYLEFEDWQTCAKFYGVTAKVERTGYVEYGAVHGFEATAVAVDRNGMEISRAESLCLDDEENWGKVPKYEWKDKLDGNGKKIWNPNLRGGKGGYEAEKIKIGEFPKPLFQLKSMAQTRACSKVLRQVFAWIVVLAGYQPTPAEELTGHEDFGDPTPQKPPVQQPQRASEVKKQQEAQQSTQAQQSQQANTQGQHQASQGQTADKPGEKKVSGIIESAKQAKSGIMWITVKGEPLVVAVDEKNIDADMVAGNYIKFRGLRKWANPLKTEKNPKGEFWSLAALIELSPVQDGEPEKSEEKPADDGKMAEDAEAVADALFGGKQETEGKAAVQGLVDSGQLKPASQLPTTTKPGTIGKKRSQRLYAIATQNKKATGFTEENIKKVLAALPIPLEHLSDLEVGMYETMEKFCTGEADWTELLKDE